MLRNSAEIYKPHRNNIVPGLIGSLNAGMVNKTLKHNININIAFLWLFRRERAEILQLMVLDDDDENDDDLDFLLLAFCLSATEKRCRLNLKDIPDDECLIMFRCVC